MHSWKKKLVVSQLALACTMAIASQANATTYNTFTYYDDATTPFSWSDWGSTDSPLNYTTYSGFIYNNAADGLNDQNFNNDVVNGVISTYYLNNDGINDGANNTLNISNSSIHGMITSEKATGTADDGKNRNWWNGTNVDTSNWYDGDVFTLNIANSTIDDDYEYFYFTDSYLNADDKAATTDHTIEFANQGVAVNLDVESNINISGNSHVAGIALYQGNTANTGYTTESHTWDNNISVVNSTVTSGSYSPLEQDGFYGHSQEPSDYNGDGSANDVALSFVDSAASDYAMKNNVNFNHSTLMGDVLFVTTFNSDFYLNGYDSNGDGVLDTNGGWVDDSLNVDELNITLDNGSKWVGAATLTTTPDSSMYVDPANMYDVAANSLNPASTTDHWGNVNGNQTFQSGVFNVALNNGSEWNTVNDSNIDTLTVNNGSQVNVASSSSLIADSITLTNSSSMNVSTGGSVGTDHLTVDSYSKVDLTDEDSTYGNSIYANTITVSNGGEFSIHSGDMDAGLFSTNTMELTNGGVFNINSSDYVLNADLVNDHTNTSNSNDPTYGYGVIAMNSDGHLTVNGNGTINNGSQEYGVDDVNDQTVAATGNYKVRINDSTGKGSEAAYKDKEIIYVNDANSTATFSAANKADLGAYTYKAEQQGNTVILKQDRLTDYANMALSIPSANTNIWNLEQDALATRLVNGRHSSGDTGGAWVTYTGGGFSGDNGVLNYDQDVNGIMVGLDKQIDGNNAKWTVGAAAGFAKGSISDNSGNVDQDSQSARIYSSARFQNNIFLDSNLSYSHYSNDLTATMSNGDAVDGDVSSDAWGFGMKLGYDIQLNQQGYVTPYASISGLFQDGDNYQLSNNMKVGSQSYDSMRYELGVDTGYTFNYGDQAVTPYFKLAYVYDDSNGNNADVNGDSIDNGVEGSAVRVGLGTQVSFTKNFGAYVDTNYLGGGDVDQDWSANLGVKYTW